MPAPGLAARTSGGVVVQRLPDGEPVAFGSVHQADYRIRVPGVAAFAFRGNSGDVRFEAPYGAPAGAVERLFETLVVPCALQVAGYEALHASAVEGDGGVVAFCGESGTGKTTLAYALARGLGRRLWADDVLVVAGVDSGNSGICIPLPHELNLRWPSRAFFDLSDEPDPKVDRSQSAEAPLAAIVLLEPSALPGVELVRLSLGEALAGILEHAFCFFVEPGRQDQAVRTFVDLVAQVPVLRLRFPLGLDRLAETVELLDRRLEAL